MNQSSLKDFPHSLLSKLKGFFLPGRIFILICLLPLLFRLMKIQSLLRLLTPRKTKSPVNPGQREEIIKWTDAILGWDFFIFKTSCLRRSLVLYHFLKQTGLPLQINFGVRKLAQNPKPRWPLLDGHGWLSLRGQSYLERGEPQREFKPIYSFPPS